MLPGASLPRQRGYSLIELVVALMLSAGIFSALMLWFERPLQAMLAAHERTDAAESVERTVARFTSEIGSALPNSVRVACAGRCLEFIPVIQQADYRIGTPGDTLDFSIADDGFDVLMPLATAPVTGMQIVVSNLDAASTGSTSAYSADANNNRATVAAGSGAGHIVVGPKQFPAPAPSQRFHVIDRPVSYLCDPAPGSGALRRYAGYAIQPNQPVALALGDLLAENVVDCEFRLIDAGLVSLRVAAGAAAGDAVTLYSQVRLVNEP
jgi:MSHA biogenesis protein MshO